MVAHALQRFAGVHLPGLGEVFDDIVDGSGGVRYFGPVLGEVVQNCSQDGAFRLFAPRAAGLFDGVLRYP